MRIAFFETTVKDRAYLSEKLTHHEVVFYKETLSVESAAQAANCDIVSLFIYSAVTALILEKMPHLKAVLTRSTGFDHVDLVACAKRGVVVENVPHYGENTVAEHTFALILALSRNVHKSHARGQQGDFSIEGLMGFDLKDKMLGVVGTGRVGLHVIRIAKGFGMHVLATDARPNTFLSEVLHFQYAPLDEVLARADIITLHVPYNEHTHHLINQAMIKKIKPGALLINTARGGVVENEALIAALDQGILSGAGLDVLEGEETIIEESQCLHIDCHIDPATREQYRHLLSRENVVFTPHIGFYSSEAVKRILDTTIENIDCFASGKKNNEVTSDLT